MGFTDGPLDQGSKLMVVPCPGQLNLGFGQRTRPVDNQDNNIIPGSWKAVEYSEK